MRVLFMVLCACMGPALSQPETGGIYLPVAARDPSSRRYLPVAQAASNSRRFQPPSATRDASSRRYLSPAAAGPASRRYLPVVRGTKTQYPPPRRPTFGGPAPFPSDEIPAAQYRPAPSQTPELPPYKPSSDELPPNEPSLAYKPDDQTSSRRYLPAREHTTPTQGRTAYHAPSSRSEPEPEYPPANYDFEYHVLDVESGNDFEQREGRQGDLVTGRYRVVLPDGRTQVVKYVADREGYRPMVSYEGQATANGGSKGYSYNKPGRTEEGYSYNKPQSTNGGYNYNKPDSTEDGYSYNQPESTNDEYSYSQPESTNHAYRYIQRRQRS